MEENFGLHSGIENQIEKLVEYEDTAAHYGSGLVEVFATPAMIALMEKTALESVKELLPEGYSTVGISVNITHVKATPKGQIVKCLSHLKAVDDKKLTFSLIARDNDGIIGTGTHERFIIHIESFMNKLNLNK